MENSGCLKCYGIGGPIFYNNKSTEKRSQKFSSKPLDSNSILLYHVASSFESSNSGKTFIARKSHMNFQTNIFQNSFRCFHHFLPASHPDFLFWACACRKKHEKGCAACDIFSVKLINLLAKVFSSSRSLDEVFRIGKLENVQVFPSMFLSHQVCGVVLRSWEDLVAARKNEEENLRDFTFKFSLNFSTIFVLTFCQPFSSFPIFIYPPSMFHHPQLHL
jgi:hypothetical protein